MTHSYTIAGMSCDGCRVKVEKTMKVVECIECKVSFIDYPSK